MVKKAKPLVNERVEIIFPFLNVLRRILCCCKQKIEEGIEAGEGLTSKTYQLLFHHKQKEEKDKDKPHGSNVKDEHEERMAFLKNHAQHKHDEGDTCKELSGF